VRLQQTAQLGAREPFVVDNRDLHAVAPSAEGAADSGIDARATTSEPSGSTVSDALSP
jgi:hypothetical protein